MQGTRKGKKLWAMDSKTRTKVNTPIHSLNAVIDNPTLPSRIRFNHAAFFSPTLETWCNAIQKGFLTTLPPFTTKQIRRNPPDLTAITN